MDRMTRESGDGDVYEAGRGSNLKGTHSRPVPERWITAEPTQPVTRRGFLTAGLVGLAGLYLAGCSAAPGTPTVAPTTAPPTAAPATAKPAAPPTVGEIRFGALLPTTGPLAEVGRKNAIVLRLVEDEVNAAGGIKGAPFKFVFYDTGMKPDQAANLFKRLVQDDRVLAVVGPVSSGECEVVFPVANQLKVVSVSQASSKPGVSAANRPYAFRDSVDEAKVAPLTVRKFVDAFKASKPAVIYDAMDATSNVLGKAILPKAFGTLGINVVNPQNPVTFQSTDTDLSAQVTKLKSLDPDSVIIGADSGPAANVVREMNRQGLFLPVIGGGPLISTTFARATGRVPAMAPATFYAGQPRPNAVDFVAKFQAHATELPADDRDPLPFDANVYDISRVLVKAVVDGGVTNQSENLAADRERIMTYLTTLKNFDGVGGRVGFDANGDGDKDVFILQTKDGKWAPVS